MKNAGFVHGIKPADFVKTGDLEWTHSTNPDLQH